MSSSRLAFALAVLAVLALCNVRIVSAQPSVQTLSATNITDTSAQLNGDLNTNGQDTDWAFKVLDSSGTEIQTVCSSAWNAGSVGQSSVNCPVYGLQPSTKYGFALIAIWHGGNGGWQYGNVVSFTTLASGPGAKTDAATGVTDTSAVLNGVVTTNGQDTEWMFAVDDMNGFVQNCPAAGGFTPAGVGTQHVTCQASGLKPSTTYSFVLDVCWGPAGGWGNKCAYGSTLSFATLFTVLTATIWTNILTKPSTTSQPKGPGFDFALSVSPSAVSVKQGDTAHYAVQVQYSDPSYYGTMINLQLMGLGPGMNWQVTQTGDLMITTTPASPTGTYTLSLTGSANGVTHQTGATLIVTSQQPTTTLTTTTSVKPFDYSVTVSPFTQSVEIGGTTSYVVSVLPLSGSPVSVSLTVTGCPGDVRSSFTTPSGNPPYTSTLNLDLSASSANAGAYTLTVVATAGGNVKTSTATLMIKEKAAQTTAVQTTTGGTSTTTAIQPPWIGGDLTWIIVGILALLVIMFAALALRRRKTAYPPPASAQPAPPTPAEKPKPTSLYCVRCGTENPVTNEFCVKCGQKLLRPNLSP